MSKDPVFYRYFKVIGGDLGHHLRAQIKDQHAYIARLEQIGFRLGATKVHTTVATGKFAGFEFPETTIIDKKTWLYKDGRWIPKRREHRPFWKIIDDMEGGSVPSSVLTKFDLSNTCQVEVDGIQYGATITGFYSVDMWWVIVPSVHADDPSWTPPDDWEEVTFGKYINEWDERYALEKNL